MKLVTSYFTIRFLHKDKDFWSVIALYTKNWSIGIVKWTKDIPEYQWEW